MADNVVDLQDYKPHCAGPFRCAQCGHEWIGVAPIPLDKDQGLQCPNCKRFFGFIEYPLSKADAECYYCNVCNSPFYTVQRDGITCAICGTRHLDVLNKLEK